MGSNVIVTIIVIVYLLFMLWIGWYSSTKISTNTDFMVAGRRLGPLLMAGTLAATEIGGGSSLGVVQNGMSGFGLSASWYITTWVSPLSSSASWLPNSGQPRSRRFLNISAGVTENPAEL